MGVQIIKCLLKCNVIGPVIYGAWFTSGPDLYPAAMLPVIWPAFKLATAIDIPFAESGKQVSQRYLAAMEFMADALYGALFKNIL